ncbi:hypothetical protein WICPIJ_008780 [Wickerhamomyces pijperi]|uniref:Amino acid permease/ SLC12A domain-containing protein n=1 Tax=Wickerhamomyces pijperi TaxID=599730 RepID=A0A9P8THF2_WICPI|nr:hypothetical protein WICPIJ_008780 [Wickerhamomyces pijperi]
MSNSISAQETPDSSLEKSNVASISSNYTTTEPYASTESHSRSLFTRFVDTFKEVEIPQEVQEQLNDPNITEDEKRNLRLKHTPLSKNLKVRHMQMIAMGSCIGTGLFIGSGSALRTGGAASLPICWSIIGFVAFFTIHSLGELATAYPVSGAFSAHATKFIEPSFGFAIGWNYTLLWLAVLPNEIIAASLTLQFWNTSINPVAWVSIFYVFVLSINLFGVKAYGEAEYIFSLIKVVAIVGFLILGIVLICGGGPSHGFVGGEYYHNPGPFANGFKGVSTVFVTACYSLGGTELVGVTSAEAGNARKFLPSAIKQVFWRIVFFFFGSLTMISLLVNSKDNRLLGTNSADASASPFVIAIKNGGIKGLPSVMNAVIMISVLSVGNSAVYGCSRTLASLSAQGLAPKCFNYIDRMGRPIYGIALNALFGLLCFTVASNHEATVFAWLMSLSGLAIVLTWSSICLSHIRFRMAMKAQGRSLDELAFVSRSGVYGSIFGLVMLMVVLGLQFWVSLFPLGSEGANATNFFQNYLGGVIALVFYIGRKLWVRKLWEATPLKEIDLDEGRAAVDMELLQQELEEERASLAAKGFFYRAYRFWC